MLTTVLLSAIFLAAFAQTIHQLVVLAKALKTPSFLLRITLFHGWLYGVRLNDDIFFVESIVIWSTRITEVYASIVREVLFGKFN